ncbi:MAG: SDR family oxidoreductase [Rhodospirillales bacterium]|nr:SDR family oxidoreductase [Rhodospirillales bacterium]
MIDPNATQRLFCFGLGYTAGRLASSLLADGWTVGGTCRTEERQRALKDMGIDALVFDPEQPLADAGAALGGATHLLNSVPPGRDGGSEIEGDPVLAAHKADIVALAPSLVWAGYLSTTGVYGNTDGALVDETAPLNPTSDRSRQRADADAAWQGLFESNALPVHVFRLPGIYGPGRSALDQVRAGRTRRILKRGHMFSRIHVDDIVQTLRASMDRPHPGGVYNVADDEPAPSSDVIAFACELLGMEAPRPIPFAEAAKDMSEMALSFWRDNRRIDNTRIKEDLGVVLLHPTYKDGLRAQLGAGE